MESVPTWEVTLYVDGPVTVDRPIRTTQQKGFRLDDPFFSDVDIQSVPTGLKARVTARAEGESLAYKAAVYFFGNMLDALTFSINRPMYLGFIQGGRPRPTDHDVRRVISEGEFNNAFHDSHNLNLDARWFLRSLGWYRKGLSADDPMDKFLAYWNSIENVASSYYRFIPTIDQARASEGSINQIWGCFLTVWGESRDHWPSINGKTNWISDGQPNWIDEGNAMRNLIAHGSAYINIEQVVKFAARLPDIEAVTYRFLRDWYGHGLHLARQQLHNSPNDLDPEGMF